MINTATMLRVHIRWMIRRDMPEVLEIEKSSYAPPYTEEQFLTVLRNRNCIGMVAEVGEKVVGYVLYELHKNRLTIIKMAVHPGYRRQAVGFQMIEKLVKKLASHRRTRIIIDVGERNMGALLFLKKMGFKAIRVLWNHFNDQDAYKMVFALKDCEEKEEVECSGR